MDIATIIGVFLGFGAVFGGQVLEGGKIGALIQPTAFLIVMGGTLGATFVSFPMKDIIQAAKDVTTAIFPQEDDPELTIVKLIGFATTARKNGLLILEQEVHKENNHFLSKGLLMLVDGQEPQQLTELMEIELNTFEEHAKASAEVFEAAGGFAPTIGIIGAVLGLIHVMNNLDNTAALGAGIAVAFVATIYGLMTANIICIPISTKLKKRLKQQMILREIMLNGLLAIQSGENPRIIEERLRGFTQSSDAPPASGQNKK